MRTPDSTGKAPPERPVAYEIPLPDFKGRIALLQLFTAGMPLDRVDVDALLRHFRCEPQRAFEVVARIPVAPFFA